MAFITIFAFLIAALIPAGVLFAIYKLDFYKTGHFRTIAYSFIWGIGAFFLARFLNPLSVQLNLVAYLVMVQFTAPILEELAKGSFMLYLVRRNEFTYFVEGAIYGFSIGIGFAIIENFDYLLSNLNAAFLNAIGRVISTNLIHASGSALIGISLGLARFEKSWRRYLFLFGGPLLAIGLHVGFNNLVTRLNVGLGLYLSFAALVGMSAAIFIAYAIKRGLAEEKKWIEEKLGLADRVSSQEAAVVLQMENLRELLAPAIPKFGSKKVDLMERLLVIQARLGILRKSYDKIDNQSMRQAIEAQIDGLRSEMDIIRKEIGIYAMGYLRSVIPPDSSPLWGRLELAIQEKASMPKSESTVSLWDTLKGRSQPTPPNSTSDPG